jgi:4-amino-4-deoxy-L-arabinose transferase-like glycosyltransferase
MTDQKSQTTTRSYLIWGCVAILLALRSIVACVMPLNDSTESRYAELARKMLQSGDWITLWHEPSIPFWAKPPLSSWLSALSMNVFGIHEGSLRLPGLLLLMLVLWMTCKMISSEWKRKEVQETALWMLMSCPLFLFLMPTVMTDPALVACLTLGQLSFWLHVRSQDTKIWSYVFFIALGLGALAKGPLAWVLTGLPIIAWSLSQKNISFIWKIFPWGWGCLLMLLISLPWYLYSEFRTPGFLKYFIMGEHIQRFLQPGWDGDLYGKAHTKTRGTILLWFFLGCTPWTIWIFRQRDHVKTLFSEKKAWAYYISLWALIPLIFFSFSRNVIPSYTMPSVVSIMMLCASVAHSSKCKNTMAKADQLLLILSGLCSALMILWCIHPNLELNSQKYWAQAWKKHDHQQDGNIVYMDFGDYGSFSADFYTDGKVVRIHHLKSLEHIMNHSQPFFIAWPENHLDQMPRYIGECLGTPKGKYLSKQHIGKTSQYVLLFQKKAQSCL